MVVVVGRVLGGMESWLGGFGFAGEGLVDEHLYIDFDIQTFLLRQFAGECEVGTGNSQVR
jgi:hypothetical protein